MGMGAPLLLTSPLPLSLPSSISSPSFPFRSSLSPQPTKIHDKAVGLHVACCSSRPPNSNDDSSWDSNAETWTTAGRFRFRINRETAEEAGGDDAFSGERRGWSWWSGDGADQLDDQDEEEEDDLFEQDPWDSFWIFKVFKSFGWLLPPIIISMLVATGPKAFLMALALPLGQSALSFAADKLWGSKPQTNQRNRATKAKKKKKKKKEKPFAQRTSYTRTQMGEEEEEEEDVRHDSFGRPAYQSWAAAAEGEDGKAGEGGGRPEPSFGGWDELENGRRAAGRRKRSSARRGGVGGKRGTSEGKLSKRGGRKKEVPLFIRLLIAVFPFLGSWTNLL